MAEAPLDLKWNIDLRLAPMQRRCPVALRGRPVASSSLIWTGDPEAGQPYLQRALSMCSPDSVSSKIISFIDLQTMADSDFPHGQRYYTKSGYFTYLDDGSIDHLLDAVPRFHQPKPRLNSPILAAPQRGSARTKLHSAIAALLSS